MRMNQRKKKCLLVIICFLTVLSTIGQNKYFNKLERKKVVSDNSIVWSQVSPGNAGYANLLRFHPTLPKVVALCPDMWNAYQSDSNGEQWYSITDADGDGSFNHLRDLYYSQTNENFGLAIANSHLWRTDDLGKTWEVVKDCPWYKIDVNGFDKESWKKKIGSLAIDYNNEKTWYVGGGTNVRGQNWMSCYQNMTAAKPHGKKGANEGKLWKTTNAGRSWTIINNGIPSEAMVGRIIINPNNSKQVFASTNYGLYRSNNGGKKWVHISKGKLDNDIIMDMDFYYNPKTHEFILYLIDQVQYEPAGKTTKATGGIFYSRNEGQTWENISDDLKLDINQLTGGVPKNYYKYIAKWFGIPVGKARQLYPELPKDAVQNFNMISADPSRLGAVYTGFADPQTGYSIMPGRLWTTNNFGKKWINTARLYQDAWEKDKTYWESKGNPTHENMIVGHHSPHMRFGNDYALRSMRALDVGVDGSVMIISDHSTMLSTDHGESWQQMDEEYTPSGAIVGRGNSNLPGLTILQDKRNETTLLGSGEHRVWIPTDDSPDDRIAIKYIESAPATMSNMVLDPIDPNIVYGTSNRQEGKQYMYKSVDRGFHWEKHGVATPATNKWKDDFFTNGLLIDPTDNKYMYFGITKIVDPKKGEQGGFFFSEDNGKTFQRRNNGLPSPSRINDVKFDSRDTSNKSLFIAAQKNIHSYHLPLSEGGLYHSTNRGESWKRIKTPSSVEGVQFIEIDHTNRLYITTGYRGGGSGVWYTDDFGDHWQQIFKFPGTECIEVSPFDNNLIAVTVRYAKLNFGVYLSRDRGKTWKKSNKNIGIPHQIEDIKFDLHDPSQMWMATLGCGYYKGIIENGDEIAVVQTKPSVANIGRNSTFQLRVNVLKEGFKDQEILWKSENSSIAKVDKKGKVTALKKGTVKIWATTTDSRYSDYTQITVE